MPYISSAHGRAAPVRAKAPSPRAERSSGDSGVTAPADAESGQAAEDLLTVPEFLALVRVARTTFDDWRAKKCAPKCIKLPNGQLRIRRCDFARWLDGLEEE